MLSALLLAAAAASAPAPAASAPVSGPDVFYDVAGCRYVRKPAAPKRSFVVQFVRPPAKAASAAPAASAASAPVPKKKRRAPAKRDAVPGYALDGCDEVRPLTPLEAIMPPAQFTPIPDADAPFIPADQPPGLPAGLPLPDLPSAPLVESGPPSDVDGPAFAPPQPPVYTGPLGRGPVVIVVTTPPIPEPETWYLLAAGLGAIAVWRSRR